ncbi:uncharacterized protein J5M81_015768 [Pluvialis apricaria]
MPPAPLLHPPSSSSSTSASPSSSSPGSAAPPGPPPCPRAPPELPEDASLEPLSEFECLHCSAGVRHPKGEGEGEKGAKGDPTTPTPRDQPHVENEKDVTTEKGKTRRGFLFKARKMPFAPPGGAHRPPPGGGRGPRQARRPRSHHEHHHVLLLCADLRG